MESYVTNVTITAKYDYLILAPDGASRPVGDPYVYLGAYSYMITRSFIPDLSLWQYLIWFPPFLASLLAIPMYYIGKIVFERLARGRIGDGNSRHIKPDNGIFRI